MAIRTFLPAVFLALLLTGPAAAQDGSRMWETKADCEKATGKTCRFTAVMCDYIPDGKTFDEVCGKDFKEEAGWIPTDAPPEENGDKE